MSSSFTYVAPFRFGRLTIVVCVIGLAAAIVGMLLDLPEDPTIVLIAGGLAIPATLAALYLPLILGGKPGLRVDQDGILFGGRPLIYKRTSSFVPWSAISEVYLFRCRHMFFAATYVGVRGHDGVLPMSQVMPTAVAETIWHVPTEVVLASRPAYGWRVDKAALTTAVGYFQSSIPVIDLTAVAAMQRQLRAAPPSI